MSNDKKIYTTPLVRKFARELGADINKIKGTERKGRITEKDIKNYIYSELRNDNENKSTKKEIKSENKFKHSDFGEVEITDIPRVKKIAAPFLNKSWSTIPHVTHHDEIDISEMEEFRNKLKDNFTGRNIKITPLVFIIKALVNTLKKFPSFNSSIDDIENGKITLKKYFHIGIAVDTPHGLMVPKIRNANKKNIKDLSSEILEVPRSS